MVIAAMKLKDAYSWEESYDQPRQHIKKQRDYFVNKGPSSQGYCFPVAMYGCQSWTIKKAEFRRIDILNCSIGKDSLESLGLQGVPTSPS